VIGGPLGGVIFRGLVANEKRPITRLREQKLAQSSDWAFLIRNQTAKDYATKRATDHLSRFARLADQFERRKVDRDFLAQCEAQDNLFPNVDWRRYG